MKTISLEGKVAVITGASRGLGRAIAEEFARAGADLVVNYNSTPCQDLVDFAEGLGRKAIVVQADISKTADCDRLIDEAMIAFGKVDILVNNAGITRDTLLMRMDEEAWDSVITTNLKSAYSTCKAVTRPMMKARSGCIINISSVTGLIGQAGQANYAASKAGLIGFTKSLAREFASRNIRVNAIAPGFMASDMTAAMDEKSTQEALKLIPMGSFGESADIANAALYLASDMGRYVTGSTLVVDGGIAMR